MLKLQGLYTALVTPFDQYGKVDEEGFHANIQYQLDHNVDGVVVLGTTGEAPTLTEQEKARLITIARKEIQGRVPLIVGTGTYSTEQTVANTLQAKQLGADAALVVTPYYNKPSQEGLYRHFNTIAQRVGLPILLYNHPGRTGTSIQLSTMRRLAQNPNIIGVKEVTSSVDQVNELIEAFAQERSDFAVLAGDDSLTFTLMMHGGKGVVSVAGNLVPEKMKRLTDCCAAGDLIKARKLHYELLPLFRALAIETNPVPIKAALDLKGFAAGDCRPPLCPLTTENLRKLRETLEILAFDKEPLTIGNT